MKEILRSKLCRIPDITFEHWVVTFQKGSPLVLLPSQNNYWDWVNLKQKQISNLQEGFLEACSSQYANDEILYVCSTYDAVLQILNNNKDHLPLEDISQVGKKGKEFYLFSDDIPNLDLIRGRLIRIDGVTVSIFTILKEIAYWYFPKSNSLVKMERGIFEQNYSPTSILKYILNHEFHTRFYYYNPEEINDYHQYMRLKF